MKMVIYFMQRSTAMRKCRNWQTSKTKDLVTAMSCGFKSHLPHSVSSICNAGMAELADAYGSGPYGSNTMRVQVSFPARANTAQKSSFPDGESCFSVVFGRKAALFRLKVKSSSDRVAQSGTGENRQQGDDDHCADGQNQGRPGEARREK